MIELSSPFEVEAAVRRRAKKWCRRARRAFQQEEGERVLMGFNSATRFDVDDY